MKTQYRVDWQTSTMYELINNSYIFCFKFNTNDFDNEEQLIEYYESLDY